jgi:hypothetical protein
MGLDRGQALGGIDIGAEALVRSQVAGKVIGIGPAVLGPVPGHGDDAPGMVPGTGQGLDDAGALGGDYRVEPVAGGVLYVSEMPNFFRAILTLSFSDELKVPGREETKYRNF